MAEGKAERDGVGNERGIGTSMARAPFKATALPIEHPTMLPIHHWHTIGGRPQYQPQSSTLNPPSPSTTRMGWEKDGMRIGTRLLCSIVPRTMLSLTQRIFTHSCTRRYGDLQHPLM